jgi:hypothetical protein
MTKYETSMLAGKEADVVVANLVDSVTMTVFYLIS